MNKEYQNSAFQLIDKLVNKEWNEKRSASRAIGMNSGYYVPMADHLLLIWNCFIFSLWYIALQLWTHIDQYIYNSNPHLQTPETSARKLKNNSLLLLFLWFVVTLQNKKYKWLISKSPIDLLYCMLIASCSHFELTIFSFNPGHLLNSCADIENLNSMQWMGQHVLSIEHVFYVKKRILKIAKRKAMHVLLY